MLHEELSRCAEPALRELNRHPFWRGLRDGTLPGEALTRFVEQDTEHLLPRFARVLARCAALAGDDAHTVLLSRCAVATVEAAQRQRAAFTGLCARLRTPHPAPRPPISAETLAYCGFLDAATAGPFAGAVGAIAPMVWFNLGLSERLRTRAAASRYAPWIDVYDPGPEFAHGVRAFLDLLDDVGGRCSPAGRRMLVEQFRLGARHERMLADGALR